MGPLQQIGGALDLALCQPEANAQGDEVGIVGGQSLGFRQFTGRGGHVPGLELIRGEPGLDLGSGDVPPLSRLLPGGGLGALAADQRRQQHSDDQRHDQCSVNVAL
ncbi:MAG: hypothetical protein KAY37_00030, partial [Phycisphaerae bacterium]|nr:hypothetical protein [Phycisphaerae bacterium]